jgi:16S rRNA (adenine1518-N6/adenine1519-N6)-dimethyltransferase
MQIKPKKSLGQNFLIDKNIQRKIITACELKPSDRVLEIGAGHGELTRLISTNVNKIYALEIDKHLCGILKDNLKGHSNIKIINQDVLRFNFSRYFRKHSLLHYHARYRASSKIPK